jgi:hypothetical protein
MKLPAIKTAASSAPRSTHRNGKPPLPSAVGASVVVGTVVVVVVGAVVVVVGAVVVVVGAVVVVVGAVVVVVVSLERWSSLWWAGWSWWAGRSPRTTY